MSETCNFFPPYSKSIDVPICEITSPYYWHKNSQSYQFLEYHRVVPSFLLLSKRNLLLGTLEDHKGDLIFLYNISLIKTSGKVPVRHCNNNIRNS